MWDKAGRGGNAMNIPEILVANGTGAVLVCFLFLLRVRGESKNSVGSELFCQMLVVTLLAQATETISFLLDGVPGAASRFWLYLMNTVCTGATVSVGFAWCLYVDFRVYRSTGRLRRRHLFLGAPLLAVLALLAANLFRHRMDLYHLRGQRLPSRSAEQFALPAAVRLLCRERVAGA